MALVVICGQPCSGKSTAALCLSVALKESESNSTIRIIDEASFHLDRNQSYADMTAEKNLRGVLRSEVDRSVSRDNIIIVDSLNSIKGYRYELWCLARAAGIRYCVLFCDAEETQCKKWNEQRREKCEATYDDAIFEDLIRRFEKPDRRNRWDSPLFELFPCKDGIQKSSAAIVDAISYLTKKVDSKTRDVKILQPTIATQSARFSEANSLYELDRATQEVSRATRATKTAPDFHQADRSDKLEWTTPTIRCRECKTDVCGLLEQGIGNCLKKEYGNFVMPFICYWEWLSGSGEASSIQVPEPTNVDK
ncbi:hypothetical protein OIU78_005164 [Salix suchowensis]|nr:hypothetical protein OIU78_005164 [Salix suchowensis]